MHLHTKHFVISLLLCLLFSSAQSQNSYVPKNTGTINFGLGNSTLPHGKYHQITLCGCNTNLTPSSVLWGGPKKGFTWDTSNQILSDVPYGEQKDTLTNETFHISKYYIASPPVFQKLLQTKKEKDTLYDIGLVLPDTLSLSKEKTSQMVYLDYNLLKPIYIKYITVEFDSTFDSLNIHFIPFRVVSSDFPWQDSEVGSQGASGIGKFDRKSTDTAAQLFLPYYYEKASNADSTRKYLDFEVSFLNDILFHYEVFFLVDGVPKSSINLKEYVVKGSKLQLTARYQKELPSGCKPLKGKKQRKK
jgi:hypothetical protein